jgi:ribosome-associated translation inhibitor RaiA
MKPLKNPCLILACASLLIGQFGCGTTASVVLSSAQFDSSAFKTDKAIKTEALALIARAKNRAPYTDVAAAVDQLMTKVDQAIAAEQGRPKNAPTVAQWKKIKAQLSSLFNLWKSKGSLSPAFVEDAGSQIGGLFDILIKTENDKPKQS